MVCKTMQAGVSLNTYAREKWNPVRELHAGFPNRNSRRATDMPDHLKEEGRMQIEE
jgi:hypothetical protein